MRRNSAEQQSNENITLVVVHVDGVRLCLRIAVTNKPIVHLPGEIGVWRATVKWYWQGKTEELGESTDPFPLCPPQVSHGLNRAPNRDSALRPATNRLSRGTAQILLLSMLSFAKMCRSILKANFKVPSETWAIPESEFNLLVQYKIISYCINIFERHRR
jgi:hypothetical protein